MKKILALLLAIMFVMSLAACGEPDYAHGSTKTVLKLGDHKVSEELYRYFLLNTMDEMADGDKAYFEGEKREERLSLLDKRVIERLGQYFSVLDLAKELKIELTGKEKEAIWAEMESIRASFADEAEYQKGLEQTYLSEYVAYLMYQNEVVYSVLYEVMSQSGKHFSTKSEDILRFAKKNFYFCRQIVVETLDTKGDVDAKQKAEAILGRLNDGEDVAKVMEDYEKDGTVMDGYYCYAEGEDYSALDEAAVAKMKVGEISELREDGYGFHIILRLEMDDAYLEENLTDSVFESYCMRQINIRLAEIAEGYKVEYKNKKAPESYK